MVHPRRQPDPQQPLPPPKDLGLDLDDRGNRLETPSHIEPEKPQAHKRISEASADHPKTPGKNQGPFSKAAEHAPQGGAFALRLTGAWPDDDQSAQTGSNTNPSKTETLAGSEPPTLNATDPRWVLARRAAEAFDGAILRPEKRQRLIRLGKVMGLSPFDAHLVIAIVQDQARRGVPPEACPAAGVQQLALITPTKHPVVPAKWNPLRWLQGSSLARQAAIITGFMLITEGLVIAWWLSVK